jgi:DNA repair protein REV1
LKHAPEYREKPAAVAHSTGSGSEIASCNYPARKFGVKNGMWMKRATELCPDLKVLPYDFPAYEEASQLFYEAILDVGGVVQSVSIDEALIDVTDIVLSATGSEGVGVSDGSVWREQEEVDEIASQLRQQIKAKTDCQVSVGIGGNTLLAKIALRKAKPAGQYQIKPEEVFDLLGELKVEDLPGVAYSIGGKLEEIGVKLVKDIRQTSKERLVSVLGPKTGEKLWEYARGIDRAEVGEQPIRKSVSADVNWGIRFISQEEAEEFVRNLSKELERRLLNEGVRGKHLTMKIMRRALDAPLDPAKHLGHGKCDTFNKSVTFGVATHDGEVIGKEAVAILRSYKFSPGDLRGLGVQMTKLEPLKASSRPQGSQKKLSFASFGTTPSVKRQKSESEPIDEGEEPAKARSAETFEEDPIADDPLTPRKPKVHPALALSRTNAADEKARTPLNIGGTQFIIPTHPDPSVLAELPNDIRSKLLGQDQGTSAAQSRQTSPSLSRSQSPALTDEIPLDFDPEVFNSLPEEMKAEVLASYGPRRRPGGQARLPQSPRKDRIIHRPKERSTPTKRGIRGTFSRTREQERKHDAGAGLMQTSFVAEGSGVDTADSSHDDTDITELDAEVLAELPEVMRREIIADHRKQRLAQRSKLGFNAPRRRHEESEDDLPRGQMKLSFPLAPPKVEFSDSSLTSTKDIQEMVQNWYNGTRTKGPHKRDVDVFERYLCRVIEEERDMEKVRKLIKWLQWIIDEEEDGPCKEGWMGAMDSLKAAVQQAMKDRGLGPMDFR